MLYLINLTILANVMRSYDTSKLIRVKNDITNNIKEKANELIETFNAKSDDFKMNKIVGDYNPGYFYGNIKSHKIDNPIRPIVSQVTTTPYNMAKTLSKTIKPYCTRNFAINFN